MLAGSAYHCKQSASTPGRWLCRESPCCYNWRFGGSVVIAVAVLSGFGAALVAPSLSRRLQGNSGWCLALVPGGLTLYFASLLSGISGEEAALFSLPWAFELGLNLSLRADGLSIFFALLISGVGTLVTIYSGGYLKGHPQLGRFYSWLFSFMAAMLGITLADNVILLFIFWELTSLTSYALIGFDHERGKARAAALQALLITGIGGLALLVGLLLLGEAGGSLELSGLLEQGQRVCSHPLYLPILLLILLGAFTKSAQAPFHFWLPSAMEAPTPVSAYLHSATMVKAGIYLLARLQPVLGGTGVWYGALTATGVATMLLGAILALHQTDLKRILAYSTVSALGTLTLLLGLNTPAAVQAALVFLLVHSLYKGALFLVVGAVDHETGIRNVECLGGLLRPMPLTALAAAFAALSMAGLPPFFGFMGKELLYEAQMHAPRAAGVLTIVGVLTNALFVAVALLVGFRPFWGQKVKASPNPHEAPLSLWLGPMLLAGLGLVMGVAPHAMAAPLVFPAVGAMGTPTTGFQLTLWHGLNPTLALSFVTIVCGVGLLAARGFLGKVALRLHPLSRWGPSQGYHFALRGLNSLAQLQTRLLQSGYLRVYLLVITATASGLVGYPLIQGGDLHVPPYRNEVHLYEWALAAAILVAALAAVCSASRLGAVAALGASGYGVALIFAAFGAPDLAMTQFLIESLAVILFVLAFYHLPDSVRFSPPHSRLYDLLASLLAGGIMTLVVLVAVEVQFYPSIAEYFARHSLPLAHGRNVVNVILVDFRALDTLGEITVFGSAALGVYALLKLGKEKRP